MSEDTTNHTTGDETELRVGETYALRQFVLKPNGYLAAVHQPEVWTPGENRFTCMCLGETHQVPDPKQGQCGFYAYTQAPIKPLRAKSNIVHAVVACYGTLVEGERGVRAEKARIVGVQMPQNAQVRGADRFAELYPQMRVFNDFDALVDEYGIERVNKGGQAFQALGLGFTRGTPFSLPKPGATNLTMPQRVLRGAYRAVVLGAAFVATGLPLLDAAVTYLVSTVRDQTGAAGVSQLSGFTTVSELVGYELFMSVVAGAIVVLAAGALLSAFCIRTRTHLWLTDCFPPPVWGLLFSASMVAAFGEPFRPEEALPAGVGALVGFGAVVTATLWVRLHNSQAGPDQRRRFKDRPGRHGKKQANPSDGRNQPGQV